jgi:hypothetical protein
VLNGDGCQGSLHRAAQLVRYPPTPSYHRQPGEIRSSRACSRYKSGIQDESVEYCVYLWKEPFNNPTVLLVDVGYLMCLDSPLRVICSTSTLSLLASISVFPESGTLERITGAPWIGKALRVTYSNTVPEIRRPNPASRSPQRYLALPQSHFRGSLCIIFDLLRYLLCFCFQSVVARACYCRGG